MVDTLKREPTVSPPSLAGPLVYPAFETALDDLVAAANQGHLPTSEFFNPSDEWLVSHMRIFQDLPDEERHAVLEEAGRLEREAEIANAGGRAAKRVWPDVAFRLDSGGLAFFSQLGVARRPDMTHHFTDGFPKNRHALAFDEDNQALFAEVFPYITDSMRRHLDSGKGIIQTDRRICDAPGRSFHARQMLFGARYLQIPMMWRHLTFDTTESERRGKPDILEVTIPHWLNDLDLPADLKERIQEAGLTKLVFKAPTKGLSLHLGFDYEGEHKVGPLSIAMFLVKRRGGLAVQAALSMARVRTLDGGMTNTAMVTVGPSLHGKSTLTIMIELGNSDVARRRGLVNDPEEGGYPMNDDIVLLQPLPETKVITRRGKQVRVTYGIDGTENNFYAVPSGLTRQDDPITYDVLRGSEDQPNAQELLENVPVDLDNGTPDYLRNPVRNMRMILSRPRLLDRKGVRHTLSAITNGRLSESAHVPMEDTDRVFWQAVMRQNTVVPPLRRLTLEQYIRVLMYGEAIQMGAAAGEIGKPYIEYFSDPFIIGLEDENANQMYSILRQMAAGGLTQEYYVFNTGGVGADSNEEATGPRYKKIPKELTVNLQEALLRGAVRFEHDAALGSDVAVAIEDARGNEVLDLRNEWLPRHIYGDVEYSQRVLELSRRRYYGRDASDKAGILQYTKVTNSLLDIADVPTPTNERELAWLLSFCWNVDQAYSSLTELARRTGEGEAPAPGLLDALQNKYAAAREHGVAMTDVAAAALQQLGVPDRA